MTINTGILPTIAIDRMANVKISYEDIAPSELSEVYAIQKHKRQLFGMFKGEECDVTFEADNSLIDTVLDKFGFDTHLSAVGEHTFRFYCDRADQSRLLRLVLLVRR